MSSAYSSIGEGDGMSFLLRRIAITADGREIVRATPVASDSITLGRDAASTVHLADLGVNPQHARISTADGRHIDVEAIAGLGFEVDGRHVDAAKGAELRFGGHRITVGVDADAPAPRIALTIQRTDELSHSALARDEAKAFSLSGKIPGRRLSAWAFSLVVLAAFLAAPIYAWMSWRGVDERPQGFHADASWSSGPLSSAHASLADDCQSCHVDAFVAVTDSSCKSCHSDAHDHAPLTRQLAAKGDPGVWRATLLRIGAAFNRPEGRCVDCHNEHEGAGPMPATAQQFCTDCHDGMASRLTDTIIGDAGDFGTSHPQFRPLVMVNPGTAANDEPLYRRMTWTASLTENNGLKFPHALHLERAGGVARMARSLNLRSADGGAALACASCHKPTPDRVGFQPVDMERDCQSCHSLTFESVGGVARTLRHGEPRQVVADLYAYYRSMPPTRPINLGGMARRRPGGFAEGETYNIYFRETAARPGRADDAVRAVFSRGGACYDCHTVTGGGTNWQVTPVHQTARFMNHGWFDHRPHDNEDCATCHAAAQSTSANQLLIPGIKTCRDCHGGEGSNADVASPCASCHEYHPGEAGAAPWRPSEDRRDRNGNRRVIAVTDGGTRRIYGGL
jgi:predicted CXXCH cytochrome family protein